MEALPVVREVAASNSQTLSDLHVEEIQERRFVLFVVWKQRLHTHTNTRRSEHIQVIYEIISTASVTRVERDPPSVRFKPEPLREPALRGLHVPMGKGRNTDPVFKEEEENLRGSRVKQTSPCVSLCS